ncbi:hypothetical protein [Streptomyces lunaelactis]|uniref:hypothetical protein n=1 Tax=Streptomyces lunaelactis TaxID=1535768 RepID=UPI001584AA8C|nr:hypothetical protein [Streptomyces lunaelactis]
MAQRDLYLHGHGAGSGVTRRCPDKEIYGRFELDMNSRLDLDLSIRATVPGPRTPHDEAAATPA